MSGSRKLLILGGIALALWGMGYGTWYAVFAEHQALDGIGDVVDRRGDGIRSRAICRTSQAGACMRASGGGRDFPFWSLAADLRSRRDPAGDRHSRIGAGDCRAARDHAGHRGWRSSRRIALRECSFFSRPEFSKAQPVGLWRIEIRENGTRLDFYSPHSGRKTIHYVARGFGFEELRAQFPGNDGRVAIETSMQRYNNLLRFLPSPERADQLLNCFPFQEGMVDRIDQK